MDKQGRASSDAGATGSVAKLLQAVALAAVLVPFGSVAVQTAPITCGFGAYYLGSNEGCRADGNQATFDWSEYFFHLQFFDRQGDFLVTVTDFPMSQPEFEGRLGHDSGDFGIASHLSGYTCIPMVDPRTGVLQPCRDFVVDAPEREFEPGQFHWSKYEFTIDWDWDSENNGYSGVGGRARVLHDIGGTGFNYDEDMCVQAELGVPNYKPCEYSPFPFISTGDTDFQSFTPALAPRGVPEPATWALFGTGVTALLYRRRRRRGAGNQRAD